MATTTPPNDGLPIVQFAEPQAWSDWLAQHHQSERGVWIQMAKKASGIPSVNHEQALEEALCYGWIDGQRRSYDERYFLQKFTPRRPKSTWSKVNRDKVQRLIEQGRMQPAGLAEIEAAQRDGRWDAAYDSVSQAVVPEDLQAVLDEDEAAKRFFESLDSRNRYAILFRLQTAKKPETRQRRLQKFVSILKAQEKIYP